MCVSPAQGQNEGPPLTVERILQPLLLRAGRGCRMVGANEVKDKYKDIDLLFLTQ